MYKIGFTHRVLYRVMNCNTDEALNIYKNSGAQIIEIILQELKEAPDLNDIKNEIKKFSRRSIHLPADRHYNNNEAAINFLNKLVEYYSANDFELALVHPDVVDDWAVFDNYKVNWAVENMDSGKSSYKNVGEFEEFFKNHPGWKLVLDINHCFTNDPSLESARMFIERLGDKIAEIHLSGYKVLHEPLFLTGQNNFIDLCANLKAPIIIESIFDAVSDVKKEYDYVSNYLAKF